MKTAVLVMAYGTPTDPDNVLDFYTDVRRGRPPTDEQLADLERRYRAIGGVSPLRERTYAQISALQRALDAYRPDTFTTFFGAKHAEPKIERTIKEITQRGYEAVVGLVLAPHFSALSVGEYIERAQHSASEYGLNTAFIQRWGADEALINILSERVIEATKTIPASCTNIEYVFSAHSLPTRVVEMGDRYPDELAETAQLVAAHVGLDHFRTGWQSAGRTTEPWLGPDILVLLGDLKDEGVEGVVVCPAGFTSDHLEVLYDLDIEAKARAEELGMHFARTRSLNDDPRVAQLLARRVLDAASWAQSDASR